MQGEYTIRNGTKLVGELQGWKRKRWQTKPSYMSYRNRAGNGVIVLQIVQLQWNSIKMNHMHSHLITGHCGRARVNKKNRDSAASSAWAPLKLPRQGIGDCCAVQSHLYIILQ